MEKHLGRFLKPTEIVHHRDGNPRNNDIDNLVLCTSIAEHKSHHRLNRRCNLCGRPHSARGFCSKHYQQFMRQRHSLE
jgi:hypothetical protein